jgi:GTP-binding protein
MYAVNEILKKIDKKPMVYESEFSVDDLVHDHTPLAVSKIKDGEYLVEGEKVDKMLGYTNLEDERGFAFFQKFLRDEGIIDQLEELGIVEGDTVNLGDMSFDYYK